MNHAPGQLPAAFSDPLGSGEVVAALPKWNAAAVRPNSCWRQTLMGFFFPLLPLSFESRKRNVKFFNSLSFRRFFFKQGAFGYLIFLGHIARPCQTVKESGS
jgi:hypothetical protein